MFSEIISHLHPIIVHFPIALITVCVVFDLYRVIRKGAFSPKDGLVLWIIAALSAAAAVASGPEEEARGITTLIHTHSTLADITLWLAIFVVAIRLFVWRVKSREKMSGVVLTAYLLISVLSAGCVLATGYFGGAMVYDQGVGVKMNGKYVNPPKHFTRRGVEPVQ
jgi:uncharacterized membrane protein